MPTIRSTNVRKYLYHPQMKFGEGNVFTGVCLPGYVTSNKSWDRSHGRIPQLSRHQSWGPNPSPTSDVWWWSLKTCSNLFMWGPTPPPGVTSSGGNWNWSTYGFQAGGMHPTGMLSCYIYFDSDRSRSHSHSFLFLIYSAICISSLSDSFLEYGVSVTETGA